MRSALAFTGVLVALSAVGCSEEPRDGGRAAAAVWPEANTACMQARVDVAAARSGRRLAARARRALPVATRTLAALQALRPGAEERAPVARLQREYERLFGLYRQAAAPRRRGPSGLAEAVASAEDGVRAQARAARLPACSPP